MDSESESERLLDELWLEKPGWKEPWQEKPGWKYTRTESLRESEFERRRARTERGAVDVPEEAGNTNDEQVAVRRADASGGYITENKHEEKRKRGIRVHKRGSGARSEEQLDEWRKTERLEHEARNTSASSDPCVARECLLSCEIQSRPGSVFVQK